MTNNLEQIKTKIYELVPRLKELSFGCRVHFQMDEEESVVKTVQYINEWETELGIVVECDEYEVGVLDAVDYAHVIGHPITLEHVIEAIAQHNGGYDFETLHLCQQWQFGKTLDNQSEETITLIGNLLNV